MSGMFSSSGKHHIHAASIKSGEFPEVIESGDSLMDSVKASKNRPGTVLATSTSPLTSVPVVPAGAQVQREGLGHVDAGALIGPIRPGHVDQLVSRFNRSTTTSSGTASTTSRHSKGGGANDGRFEVWGWPALQILETAVRSSI